MSASTRSTGGTDRILTKHPEGKQGVNIERAKYEEMARAIRTALPAATSEGIGFRELRDAVALDLDPDVFPPEASVSWYFTTVKLDLEARGQLKRLPGSGAQRLVRGSGR